MADNIRLIYWCPPPSAVNSKRSLFRSHRISSAAPLPLPDAITRDYLLHHRLCPVGVKPDGVLRVAAAPDAFPEAFDERALLYNSRVVIEETSFPDIQRLIERITTSRDRSVELEAAEIPDDFAADVRDLENQPPVIRYVNLLVRDAYDAGASDIHLEASRDGLYA